MTIKDTLQSEVDAIVKTRWADIPTGTVIPAATDLTYGNTGINLDVTMLYADISDSTVLVDSVKSVLAAEYYKTFLKCASLLVVENDGVIEAYDGDRVMAVFIGDDQTDRAVKTALELHAAVRDILNPSFSTQYPESHRPLGFTVGIDSGTCLATKVGTRGEGELAWIGAAANYAAKLNSFEGLDHNYPIRITAHARSKLTKYIVQSDGASYVWQGPYNNLKTKDHYRSSCWIPL